ncbi:hypothetical protein JCM5353_001064 [Sporobolomyces roseus]
MSQSGSVHARLAQTALSFLRHPAFAKSETESFHPLPPLAPIKLHCPLDADALQDTLVHVGCSKQAIAALVQVYTEACQRLASNAEHRLAEVVEDLRRLPSDLPLRVDALREGFGNRYVQSAAALRADILQEVQLAKSRYSTSSSSISSSTPSILATFSHPLLPQQAPAEAAGNFTEEVVGILQKAFETKDTLTRAEVKSLAAVTHLNTKQIRTWFANQRQRRGGRKGAAPYNLAIARPPTQRNAIPRRNVSNSSSDSSLISYSDSNVSLTPPKHNSFFPSPSIELLPPPPQHRKQEPISFPSYVPSHSHEEVDVPMMYYTEPTPTQPQFALPLPLESTHVPLPSPPTTAKTDAFFSLPLPSTHTPPLSYSPTDSSPFPSPPQHHNSTQLSFLDQLQSTDPFLDDQFLQNVFGNLGVTANGGLTLMMDTIEDSEGQSGKGFSFGW